MNLKFGFLFLFFPLVCIQAVHAQNPAETGKIFKAGAATSNITPKIGSSINGSMKDITIRQIHDETHARAIVMDDGQTRLAIVVADLCMVSREVLDAAKLRANSTSPILYECPLPTSIIMCSSFCPIGFRSGAFRK